MQDLNLMLGIQNEVASMDQLQSHGALGETSDNCVDTNIFLYQPGTVLV